MLSEQTTQLLSRALTLPSWTGLVCAPAAAQPPVPPAPGAFPGRGLCASACRESLPAASVPPGAVRAAMGLKLLTGGTKVTTSAHTFPGHSPCCLCALSSLLSVPHAAGLGGISISKAWAEAGEVWGAGFACHPAARGTGRTQTLVRGSDANSGALLVGSRGRGCPGPCAADLGTKLKPA